MTQLRYHWCKISKISQAFVYIQTILSEPISNNKLIQKKEYKLLLKAKQNIGENPDTRETFLELYSNQKSQPVSQRLLNNNKSIDFSLVDSSVIPIVGIVLLILTFLEILVTNQKA